MQLPTVTPGRRNNKRFNYKPRYYNEEKEELMYRVERAKREIGEETGVEGFQERIRKGYKYRSSTTSEPVNKHKHIARVRTMTTAGILGLLAYLFFYTDVPFIIYEAFYK